MFRDASRKTVTSGYRSADRTPTDSSTAGADRADGTRRRPEPPAVADGGPPGPNSRASPQGEAIAEAFLLEPRTDQQQIRRAGRQQRHRERDMHALSGRGFEGRSHGQNIRRFYQTSLADYFCGDSGLVYDSGTLPSHLDRDSGPPPLTCPCGSSALVE